MIGSKMMVMLSILVVMTVNAAKRNAQCNNVCQGKMTVECCECIGCNQGMRFGKRSMSYNIPFDFDDEIGVEEVLEELENELASRPHRLNAKKLL
ncbi:unnamed protein product [Caenorhabditis angaria]|uniref:Uncharacterized protein n=1 Tax=Caenorhabditis angaria TaxID=860376 RepID=A0A9P1J0E0_9PELO|nr:unnamed protein product [Caenorhabditis angaria]